MRGFLVPRNDKLYVKMEFGPERQRTAETILNISHLNIARGFNHGDTIYGTIMMRIRIPVVETTGYVLILRTYSSSLSGCDLLRLSLESRSGMTNQRKYSYENDWPLSPDRSGNPFVSAAVDTKDCNG